MARRVLPLEPDVLQRPGVGETWVSNVGESDRAVEDLRGGSAARFQSPTVAARSKNTYLRAQFLRLKSRRGPAILAVASSMLVAAYHMLKHDVDYRDLGADFGLTSDRCATTEN